MLLLLAAVGCSGNSAVASTARSHGASALGLASGANSLPARWWSWAESVPAAENPVDDPTGAYCAQNQPNDVWFLAGTHGGSALRTCSIPSGSEIYMPIINQVCIVPSGQTSTEALASCTASVDAVNASLDGRTLRPKEETSKTAFTFTAQPRSSTGFSAGPHQAVAWGLWIGPMQLSTGKHILAISGRAGTFTTTVTYRLTVTGVA